MKKLLFFLFTLVVLASGCGKKNTFTLEGSIKGLPSDTILVFYQEPDYKLDTILLSKGKFTYTITPDTFTIFSLLLGEKQILPIYADKGESVTLNGMAGKIEVKGKGENAQLAKHIQYLSTLENNKAAVMTAVDSLIKTNPSSYSNIYLIDKYYVQDSLPDYNHIDQLIKGLSGIIKDTPYIIELQNKLSEKKELTEHRYVSNISCTDKKGKTVNWNSVKGKYVLLDFWAPWCAPCRMVVPIMEEIASERPDIKVGKINVDEQPELASKFGIMSIPTLVVMKNGKIVTKVSGARPKKAILEML